MSRKMSGDRPVRILRKKLGMNQSDFWANVGVTQSGGSRYESGRNLSRPIDLLIKLVYGKDGVRVLQKIRRRIDS